MMHQEPVHRFSHEAMATVFEVFIAGRSRVYAGQAARAAFDEVDRLERLLSRFDPSSETSRIGRLRPGESLPIGIETAQILGLSAFIQAETGGAFDVNYRAAGLPAGRPLNSGSYPFSGNPLEAARDVASKIPVRGGGTRGGEPDDWFPGGRGVRGRSRAKPERGTLRNREKSLKSSPPALPTLIGIAQTAHGFEVTRLRGRSKTGVPPLELDLGAIGKGFALDAALAVLKEWGIKNVLLHAGTSTALAAGPGPGRARTARGWPVGAGAVGGTTTADGERFFLRDGALSGSGTEVKGEHIIDPRTGRPARGHRAAWSSHPSAAAADALSTAFLVMGTAEVAGFCRRHPGVWALVKSGPKKSRIFNAGVIAGARPVRTRRQR